MQNARRLITAESGNSPVAANAGRKRGQLEDKWPYVGVGVSVGGCDVDPGVGACTLAHLGLPGYQHRCVVIHVNQVDLEGSCPAGLRWAWWEVRGKRGEKEIKRKDGEIITQGLEKAVCRGEAEEQRLNEWRRSKKQEKTWETAWQESHRRRQNNASISITFFQLIHVWKWENEA